MSRRQTLWIPPQGAQHTRCPPTLPEAKTFSQPTVFGRGLQVERRLPPDLCEVRDAYGGNIALLFDPLVALGVLQIRQHCTERSDLSLTMPYVIPGLLQEVKVEQPVA